jgi:hypothetical protein
MPVSEDVHQNVFVTESTQIVEDVRNGSVVGVLITVDSGNGSIALYNGSSQEDPQIFYANVGAHSTIDVDLTKRPIQYSAGLCAVLSDNTCAIVWYG